MRDVDEDPVAWREAGEGPAVLFLHGLGMSRTGFDPQLTELSHRRRCIAWDMPGYGASPLPAGGLTFPLLADAVAALLDRLGLSSAHLVGLSMGGQIALHAALAHPARVRSLALLDTSPAFGLDGTDPEEWKRLRLEPLEQGAEPAAFAEQVLRGVMGPRVTDAQVAEAVATMSRITAPALAAAVRNLVTHDVRARLGEIEAPTLVLCGELDEETPLAYSEALRDGIAGAELAIVPGVGHVSNLEAPETVNALLSSFLDRVEAA